MWLGSQPSVELTSPPISTLKVVQAAAPVIGLEEIIENLAPLRLGIVDQQA